MSIQIVKSLFSSLIIVFILFVGRTELYSQSELSTKFIGDRFNVYNGQVNYKIWSIAEFFVANTPQFNLSIEERITLRGSNKSVVPKHYLFEEESYWIQQTYRDVSLVDSLNLDLKEEVLSVLSMLKEELSNPKLSIYKDDDFVELLFEDEIDTSRLMFCNKISLKETWYYDKVNNKLQNDILGFGLELQGRMVWLYYPKLKSIYKSNFPSNKLGSLLKKASFITGSQALIRSSRIINDFEFLVLERMHRSFVGDANEGEQKEVIELVLSSGEIMQVSYVNRILSGEYSWYYSSGKVRSTGSFKGGVRDGQVRYFYRTGEIMSIQNYSDGFMEGRQESFDRDGNLTEVYHFVDKVLAGTYLLNSKEIEMKGQLVKGLCTGLWTYDVQLPEIWKKVLQRNPKYFDDHYKFESKWNSKVLLANSLTFSASYSYSIGEDCLNHNCLHVEVRN